MSEPTFFRDAAAWRKWLEKNYDKAAEKIVERVREDRAVLIGNRPAVVRHEFADDHSAGGTERARAEDAGNQEGEQRLRDQQFQNEQSFQQQLQQLKQR